MELELKRGLPGMQGGLISSPAGLMTVVLLLPMLSLVLLYILRDDPSKASLLGHLGKAVMKDPQMLLILGLLPLVLGYLWAMDAWERLLITDSSIRYRSPMHGPFKVLQKLQPDWELNWKDVKAIGLAKPEALQRPIQWRLTLVAGAQTKVLEPMSWVQVRDQGGVPLTFQDLLRRRQGAIETAVMQSALVKAVTARGYDLGYRADQIATPAAFNLLSDKRSVTLLWMLAALGGYGLLDAFFNPYIYAVPPSVGPYLAAAVLAGAIGFHIGQGLPRLEQAMLALLVAGVAAFANHCLLLRINEFTDSDGPATYRYRMTAAGSYQPMAAELPPLEFVAPREFWAHFTVGSERDFVMVRGALGFWQVNMGPLKEEMSRFYERKR